MGDDNNYSRFNSPDPIYPNGNTSANTDTPTNVNASEAKTSSAVFGNGVNLQPSYSNNGVADLGWVLMKKYPKIKTVRIEVEPGQESNAKRWIKEAKDNGYDVIVTYHDYKLLASDDPIDLLNGANWWVTNYQALSTSGAFTVNLMNEWGSHTITTVDYVNAYNKAITMIRTVYKGPIIVDLPGYGQETQTAAEALKGNAGIKITDHNIILSVHVYPNAFNQRKNRGLLNADLDDLSTTGVDCMIGEFGNQPANPPKTKWDDIVTYAHGKGWPVLGWAWKGDAAVAKANPNNMNMIVTTDTSGKVVPKDEFEPFVSGKPFMNYIPSPAYFNTIYSKL
jgi:mannan endo-1,4-beta-mannosidase